MADELKKEPGVQVEMVKGGLGEFTVLIDNQKALATSRLWYPRPGKVVKDVQARLAEMSLKENG